MIFWLEIKNSFYSLSILYLFIIVYAQSNVEGRSEKEKNN